MSALILTRKTVVALPNRDSPYIAYDSKLAGFGCRVMPTGAKSWVVEYRPAGGGRRTAKRRITLGKITTVPADAARRKAGEILARARLGEDVAAEIKARRQALTVRELVDRFMAEEIRPTRKPRTAAHYAMLFRRHVLPELGAMRAVDVIRSDVAKLHRAIGTETPVTANRVVTLISGLYSWGEKAGEVPEELQPAKRITRYREEGRERYLSIEELGRLGHALREAETVGIPWQVDEGRPTTKHAPKVENRRYVMSPHAVAAIRLLLFTGCRLREILHLKWEEVDFDRGMLFLPDSKTGRRPVMLSAVALRLLQNIPRIGAYVIIGDRPDTPRHDLQRPWAMIAQRAGLQGVRLHDLRHSFAATGAGGGIGLLMIGNLLGHRNLETTRRYAHLDASPLRMAANQIANQLAAAVAGHKPPLALPSGAIDSRESCDLTISKADSVLPRGLAVDEERLELTKPLFLDTQNCR
jgi:integrase